MVSTAAVVGTGHGCSAQKNKISSRGDADMLNLTPDGGASTPLPIPCHEARDEYPPTKSIFARNSIFNDANR